MISNNKNMPRA